VRGFSASGCRSLLKDYVKYENVDIIGLQEMIKPNCSMAELKSLEFGCPFT
jgi:hypothetical protein